ncbi:MAG: hypothetical protein ACI9R3_005769, partial [Verrucomicrobiales bacterium]
AVYPNRRNSVAVDRVVVFTKTTLFTADEAKIKGYRRVITCLHTRPVVESAEPKLSAPFLTHPTSSASI